MMSSCWLVLFGVPTGSEPGANSSEAQRGSAAQAKTAYWARLVCACFAACTLLTGRAARADDDATAAARAVTEQATAEYALGHYSDALRLFEHAFKLKQVPALLFNIAQCHRLMKQFDDAATTYRSFIRLDPANRQVATAERLLAEVEGALAKADSAQRTPPTSLQPHPDEATAKPAAANVAPLVKPTVRQTPTAATAHPSLPAHAEGGRPWKWVAAGGAVAALGAGALFGLQSQSTASAISGSQHPRAQVDDLKVQLRSQALKANVLFAVGGGLALVSTLLFTLHF